MLRSRRVGTLTSGLILMVFGVLFLARLVFPGMSYSFISSLWPLILVFLGGEVIVAYIINKEEILRYDFWAIMLVITITFFAMCMGGAEFIINHMAQAKGTIRIY